VCVCGGVTNPKQYKSITTLHRLKSTLSVIEGCNWFLRARLMPPKLPGEIPAAWFAMHV
jgi:hypothetical protein